MLDMLKPRRIGALILCTVASFAIAAGAASIATAQELPTLDGWGPIRWTMRLEEAYAAASKVAPTVFYRVSRPNLVGTPVVLHTHVAVGGEEALVVVRPHGEAGMIRLVSLILPTTIHSSDNASKAACYRRLDALFEALAANYPDARKVRNDTILGSSSRESGHKQYRLEFADGAHIDVSVSFSAYRALKQGDCDRRVTYHAPPNLFAPAARF